VDGGGMELLKVVLLKATEFVFLWLAGGCTCYWIRFCFRLAGLQRHIAKIIEKQMLKPDAVPVGLRRST
jgi:hypothetical protein